MIIIPFLFNKDKLYSEVFVVIDKNLHTFILQTTFEDNGESSNGAQSKYFSCQAVNNTDNGGYGKPIVAIFNNLLYIQFSIYIYVIFFLFFQFNIYIYIIYFLKSI